MAYMCRVRPFQLVKSAIRAARVINEANLVTTSGSIDVHVRWPISACLRFTLDFVALVKALRGIRAKQHFSHILGNERGFWNCHVARNPEANARGDLVKIVALHHAVAARRSDVADRVVTDDILARVDARDETSCSVFRDAALTFAATLLEVCRSALGRGVWLRCSEYM
jgi:hypothetical protein